MPTPTGTISLSDVNTELGYSSNSPISMNDAAVRSLAGVGGSGTIITMDNLRGKSNLSAALPQYNPGTYDVDIESMVSNNYETYTQSNAEIVLSSDGSGVYRTYNSYTGYNNVSSFTWKTGGGSVSDYYAYFALSSGVLDYGTANTALVLSSTRTFGVTMSAYSYGYFWNTASGTLSIRNAAGTVLASRTVYLYADVNIS